MIATSGINVANVYKQYGNSVDVLQVRTYLLTRINRCLPRYRRLSGVEYVIAQ